MKKIVVIFLAALILLTGCNAQSASKTWRPHTVSENIKPYAEKALNLVEQYLSFEITLKEFYEGISSVHNRIDRDDCEDQNSADSSVCSAIFDLYLYYDEFNDNTFRMYRDILRFQLGQTADGTYSPSKRISAMDYENPFDESKANQIGKRLNLQQLPVHDASICLSGDPSLPTIYLTFDLMNGITPEDVFAHFNALIDSAQNEGICIDTLFIFYHIYGQTAFSVHVMANDSGEYTMALGLDTRSAADREYVALTDENIQRMIDSASSYVSNYTK